MSRVAWINQKIAKHSIIFGKQKSRFPKNTRNQESILNWELTLQKRLDYILQSILSGKRLNSLKGCVKLIPGNQFSVLGNQDQLSPAVCNGMWGYENSQMTLLVRVRWLHFLLESVPRFDTYQKCRCRCQWCRWCRHQHWNRLYHWNWHHHWNQIHQCIKRINSVLEQPGMRKMWPKQWGGR